MCILVHLLSILCSEEKRVVLLICADHPLVENLEPHRCLLIFYHNSDASTELGTIEKRQGIYQRYKNRAEKEHQFFETNAKVCMLCTAPGHFSPVNVQFYGLYAATLHQCCWFACLHTASWPRLLKHQ